MRLQSSKERSVGDCFPSLQQRGAEPAACAEAELAAPNPPQGPRARPAGQGPPPSEFSKPTKPHLLPREDADTQSREPDPRSPAAQHPERGPCGQRVPLCTQPHVGAACFCSHNNLVGSLRLRGPCLHPGALREVGQTPKVTQSVSEGVGFETTTPHVTQSPHTLVNPGSETVRQPGPRVGEHLAKCSRPCKLQGMHSPGASRVSVLFVHGGGCQGGGGTR